MKQENERGQVSLEFIMLVGIVLVIVLTIIPYILKENELNKGLAAARDGAEFGASMRGMGFYSSTTDPENINPEGVIKIDRIEYTILDNPSGLDNVTISVYVRGPAYLKTTSVYGTIKTETQRFIGKAMSGKYSTKIVDRTGSYYVFAPVYCNSSTWITT
jgi:hypothetical protein